MGRRLELQALLIGLLGSSNVYFQPPTSKVMLYPCIRYERGVMSTKHANNRLYSKMTGYTITVIDADPDSEIPDKVLALLPCAFDRHYTADNLNHDVFIKYY